MKNWRMKKMSKKRRVERYTVKTQNPNKAPFEPAPYTYLALDSCILIDFLKLIDPNSKVNKKSPYYLALRELLGKSVYRKDGSINIDGKYIFCVLPTVLEEVSNPNHQLHNVMKDFIQNRTVVLELDQFKEKGFENYIISNNFPELAYQTVAEELMNNNADINKINIIKIHTISIPTHILGFIVNAGVALLIIT